MHLMAYRYYWWLRSILNKISYNIVFTNGESSYSSAFDGASGICILGG